MILDLTKFLAISDHLQKRNFFLGENFFTPQLGAWGLRLRGLRGRAEEVDQGEVSTMILGMMSQQDSIHLYMNVVSVLKHSS